MARGAKIPDTSFIPPQPVTVITLQVNKHPVKFTFVGHPTVEYMEAARKQAEQTERDNTKIYADKAGIAKRAALIRADYLAARRG